MTPHLNQNVTYWTTLTDGFGGQTFGAPVALKGRWEEKSEVFMSPNGKELVSKAVVFLDTDVVVDNWLYLGTSTATDPSLLEGATKIVAFRKLPNLGAVRFERKAFL